MYHVVIENLNSLGNQINPLLMAVIVAIITAALSWLIQSMRDHHLKEEESREKLYAPLRLHLSTLRSIDRHFRKIRQAGDEADRYIQKILDPETNMKQIEKSMSSRVAYLNEVLKEWHECVDKIYESLQSNSGLIKKEHYKTVDKFGDGYIAANYFEKQTSEKADKLYPVKHYCDKNNARDFKIEVHELVKKILGDTVLDTIS